MIDKEHITLITRAAKMFISRKIDIGPARLVMLLQAHELIPDENFRNYESRATIILRRVKLAEALL